jgi:SAM-dependent methyltransferase
MAHFQQAEFIKSLKAKFPKHFFNVDVLEIGSLNINGTVRDFFNANRYVGVDVGEGPGVDVVMSGHEYKSEEPFDCCISCECFEHNPFWKETFVNMIDQCKPGGLVVMTCATTGRPEHGTERSLPQDSPLTLAKGWSYYKNLTERDFKEAFNFNPFFKDWAFSVNEEACDLYFYGIKQ